jgi:hypothetical protein
MTPFGTRTRAHEFARLLDEGRTNGPTTTSAQAPHAALALQLRAAGTAQAPSTAPRAEFRDALRSRLVAVATVQAAQAAATPLAVRAAPRLRRQQGLAVAAGAMASVVVVAGVAVAGSRSLPGDPFYGVKRGTEALELATAGSAFDKGSRHLEFAAARLREVRGLTLGRDRALAMSGTGPQAAGSGYDVALDGSLDRRVRDTLADMDSETRLGNALLTAASRDLHRDTGLLLLARFAGQQARDLHALLPDLPARTRPRAQASLALVSTVGAQADRLLTTGTCATVCPTAPAPATPGTTGSPRPTGSPAATASSPAAVPARTGGTSPAPGPAGPGAPSLQSAAPSDRPGGSPLPVPSPISLPPLPVPAPSVAIPSVPALPIPLSSAVPVPSLLAPVPSLRPLPGLLPGRIRRSGQPTDLPVAPRG